MGGQHESGSWSKSLALWTVNLMAGWTAALAILLGWNYRQIDENALRLATVDARASYERDIAFRRWAARHGGVYVPETESTPPNPLLAHVPERDLVAPTGRRLTLMNSAYISRQIYSWYQNSDDARGHVTSLRPLRPENAPDEWEMQALKAFEAGQTEVIARTHYGGRDHLRLMRPMIAEAECLKCHAVQGYQVGDVRGGVSISVPMDNYTAAAGESRRFVTLAYSAVWLLGIAGLGTAGIVVGRRARAQRASDLARLAAEQKFRVIFNQSFHLAGVLSPDGTIIDVNTCALDFAGVRLEDVVGTPFWEGPWWRHDPAEQEQLRRAIRLAADEGQPSRFMTSHRDRSGAPRIIDFSLRPVKDAAGRTFLLVPEGMDVTDGVRAEEEKANLAERLLVAQKLESLGRLAGGVAHDFNNLLSPVLGYADMLLAGKPEGHPDRSHIEAILDAANRARGLTGRLLACARKQPIQSRPVDLNAVVRDFAQVLRRTLPENIMIDLQLAPSVLPVEADPRQVEQILLNLAINAQDAMPGGGRLTIRTGEAGSDAGEEGRPGSLPRGRRILLSVADTGCGMDRTTADRVFEPFFTTKPHGKGTGLGLATVYGIVQQHGGQIELASEPGCGTTFTLWFARTTQPIEVATPVAPQPLHGDGRTILVVEDNDAVRRMACSMLENHGYRVIEAPDGPSAIKAFESRSEPIDLLVTDVVMPLMGGRQLYEHLAARCPGLAVVFMSGYSADGFIAEAGANERIAFIQKPFSFDEFAARIRSVLESADLPAGAR